MEVHDIVWETEIKTIPKGEKKKISKKAKWLSEVDLKIADKKKRKRKKQRRKRKIYLFEYRVQKNSEER